MNAEVAQIRPQIVAIVGCSSCALGIAIDIVGQRYGEAPIASWSCGGKNCKAAVSGIDETKTAAINAIADALPDPILTSSVQPAPPAAPDPRLPPERDEEAPI
jgi:hypothetical protein